MASIIVRGLDESVKDQLAAQAKEHGRSMEAEVRDILTRASLRPHIGIALMRVARETGGAEGLRIPERSDAARSVDSHDRSRYERHLGGFPADA
ncbi:Arc family DNA-binding protein [Ornithinimicrobium faecis]|uniref:Arc family DNA-binding protein n=1 Tax=Ornithinimicrobium faecis TaxID=2934158 RepID=A0ABY4YY01_9MICO|nr:Arc family DNA-binding protein [Ornithinimicrobium sp. HY1793]USQ80982.1 Arc family DNA-binding protein [Ornithinimicrobium sp. HY1793]